VRSLSRFVLQRWNADAGKDDWTAFDEIYTQPTGEVPLVGMGKFRLLDHDLRYVSQRAHGRRLCHLTGSTTPFFGRLAKWLGIEVHAEARNEYKSFVQPVCHSLTLISVYSASLKLAIRATVHRREIHRSSKREP